MNRFLALLLAGLASNGCAARARPAPPPEAPVERRPISAAELEDVVSRLRAQPAPAPPSTFEARVWAPLGPGRAPERWTLHADGAPLCEMPCTRSVEPGRRLVARRSPDGAQVDFPPDLGVPVGRSADVFPHPGRGSPLGAFVVGGVAVNALLFGGILATGYCRESRNNASQSDAGCTASIAAAATGAAVLLGAIGWGAWSRRPHVETRLLQ